MTSKFGVFSETQHGADVFVDSVKPDPRDKGLNFKVATCKTGKLNDATFDKLQPLFAGDPFVEPLKSALQQKNAARKHNVTDRPWKAASPMKRSACPGDWVGTMQGKPLPHVPGGAEAQPKMGEVVGIPANIMCGRANTVSCRQQAAHGIACEYDYIADPIHQAMRQQPAAGGHHVVPFRPVNPPKKGGPGTLTRNFGNRPKGAVGEFEWQPRPDSSTDQCSGRTSRGGGAAAAEPGAAATAVAQSTAFKPAAFPRKGPMATFDRYPEHLHNPERERELPAVHAGGAWRPTAQVKTDATRSIMRMNL